MAHTVRKESNNHLRFKILKSLRFGDFRYWCAAVGVLSALWANSAFADGALLTDRDQGATYQTNTPLTKQDLLANMPLFSEILLQAITDNRLDDVRVLLPSYQNAANHEIWLADYAVAKLALDDGKVDLAIAAFERILVTHPDWRHIREQLSYAYIADGRSISTQKQLKILQAADLDEVERAIVARMQHWLDKQDDWQLNVSASFLYDKNINNAPKHTEVGGWKLTPAMSAVGGELTASVQKTQPIFDHWYWQNTFDANAKLYSRHRFNDIHTAVSSALIYRDAKTRVSIAPIVTRRWYGGDGYSRSVGVQAAYRQSIAQDAQSAWYFHAQGGASRIRHDERDFLDGAAINVAVGLWRSAKDNQFGAQLIHHRQSAKDDSESFHATTVVVSFEKDWGQIGTLNTVAITRRHHDAPDIFGITRDEWQYRATQQIWHKKLQFHGFVPALQVSFERTDSNHFAFDTKDWRATVLIEKRF